MCGIVGFCGFGSELDLQAMGNAINHRGPDGNGVYVDKINNVYLGHRRLSILDIQGGSQPMWNEDGQIGVVFNGEIYNHLDLRKELIAKGHIFKSDHSDTEVLVHGYEEWGHDLPIKINGMFAFAIYDRANSRVFMARDRFGKKPLYYSSNSDVFAFASELTALNKHPNVAKVIDSKSINRYFAYGFIPAPYTLYKDTLKIPGGHWLSFDISTHRLTLKQYWKFSIESPDEIPNNAEEKWSEELRALLSQGVRRRLISDVPLGIFLSGGIDSSAILAFSTAHAQSYKPKTFSIGFNEDSFDESEYAKIVADLFNSEHKHKTLNLETAGELIPQILSKLDEPMGDSSLLPTYLLCKFAREHVTVALGGDGGDELFAGYDTFKALAISKFYQHFIPNPLHKQIRKLADCLLPVSNRNMSLDFKIRRGLRGVSYSEAIWNPVWLGALEPCDLVDLFNQPLSQEELYEEAIQAWNSSNADNIIDKTLEFYTRFYLQDDILTKVDRASMMVSLEVRAPFLDNDVVEFARKIPHQYKYRNGTTKYLLKKALEPILPKNIIYRKKKGFGIPLARWLKTWHEPENCLVSPKPNLAWVSKLWHEHQEGKADHRLFLWCWIVLQYNLNNSVN